jgi:peptidoglycan/LPS O-acetylase OafA/YrhL
VNTPVTAKHPQSRLLQLDVLRGIAAVLVLLFHYTTRFDQLYGHSPPILSFYLGQRGVDLFFVISGFVVFMTIERTQRGLDFIVSRFSRLYPAYWTAVLITFAAVRLVGLPGREVSIRVALANLSMLSAYLRTPYVDSVYWTLSLELSFYAIILVLYESGMLERIELVCAAWLSLTFAVAFAGARWHLTPPYFVELLIVSDYAQLFVGGVIAYRIWNRGLCSARAVILLGAILVQCYIQGATAGVIAAVSIAAVFAAAQNRLQTLQIAPLIFLGNISYSLYLIHQNVGYVVIRAGYAAGLNSKLSIAIATGGAIMLAAAMTFLVERPAMRAIRNWYRRFSREPEIAAARSMQAPST